MTPYEIPLTPEPQSFTIQLGGIDYYMTLAWNRASACWVLDIADEDRLPIVNGIPLVTGLDLLEPYAHLGFTGALLVQTDFDADAVPTFDNLGITGRLYFVTEP
jgi:hypothetical protein